MKSCTWKLVGSDWRIFCSEGVRPGDTLDVVRKDGTREQYTAMSYGTTPVTVAGDVSEARIEMARKTESRRAVDSIHRAIASVVSAANLTNPERRKDKHAQAIEYLRELDLQVFLASEDGMFKSGDEDAEEAIRAMAVCLAGSGGA